MRGLVARVRRQLVALLAGALLALAHPACGTKTAAHTELMLLTTTTTEDSGILLVLVNNFEKQTGIHVKTIIAGSGDVLKQGARGEGDVVLSHSPAAEKEWMQEGNGTSRRLVMYNDFILVGPASDPAQIKGSPAVKALQQIAVHRAPFVSRGDRSGTHIRELALWHQAGVNPQGQPWYIESGQGQGLTLDIASQQQRYALTDRGTWLVLRQRLDLQIHVENDPGLLNLYHVMPVNPVKFPRVNAQAAQAFADFLLSPTGQQLIADFGKERFGRSLFTPAAGKTEEELLGLRDE
jgi:tungstate transport system substrate-binding protein